MEKGGQTALFFRGKNVSQFCRTFFSSRFYHVPRSPVSLLNVLFFIHAGIMHDFRDIFIAVVI